MKGANVGAKYLRPCESPLSWNVATSKANIENVEKLLRKWPEKSSYGGNLPDNQSKKSSDGDKIHDGRAK